jgi:hypothetical protein
MLKIGFKFGIVRDVIAKERLARAKAVAGSDCGDPGAKDKLFTVLP